MLSMQFSSLNMSKCQLEAYLQSVGYWSDEHLRRRNAYVLSPCAYGISEFQKERLDALAKTVYGAVERIAQRATYFSNVTPRTREEQEFLGVVNRSDRGLLVARDEYDVSVSPVIKVDLVQGAYGEYYAIEIDAYNPRGLGFNALLGESVSLGCHSFETFNTMFHLSEMIREFSPKCKIVFIVSEYERYYEPSFEILKNSLAKFGIEMTLLREERLGDGGRIIEHINSLSGGYVFMIPESLNNRNGTGLRDNLLNAYRKGELQFFFPPKAYLGSKMLLPYMRDNECVKEFIPETRLMSKKHNVSDVDVEKVWVLKAGQSSGMKGVLFSDLNQEEFVSRFKEEKNRKRPLWILQEHVEQEPFGVELFSDDWKNRHGEYYLRLTAQVCKDGIIGLEVTGRKDRMVHGAPDCIMLPAVLP